MRFSFRPLAFIAASIAALVAASSASAQQPQPTADSPAKQPTVATPAFDFSGVLFGNFNYGGPQTVTGARTQNQFQLDRLYLNFGMPAGDRYRFGATTDLYNLGNGSYSLRLKYAYVQANYIDNGPTGTRALARLGLVQTPIVGYSDAFWPRFIAAPVTDRFNYNPAADLGIMTLVQLPNGLGEFQGDIVNGPGYQNTGAAQQSRFKDFSARLSIVPFASAGGLLKTFAITGWGVAGTTPSQFVNGGTGARSGISPIGRGLDKSRFGTIIGVRDPRLTGRFEYHYKHDEAEVVNTTAPITNASVSVVENKADVISASAVIKPFLITGLMQDYQSLGLLFRWDEYTPNRDASPQGKTDFVVAGVIYDLSKRVSIAADYQEQTFKNGLASGTVPGIASLADSRTWYLHFVTTF